VSSIYGGRPGDFESHAAAGAYNGAGCAEFAEAGFLIERLVEPRPVPEMEKLFPETYRQLSERPSFIMFSLLRP